MRRIIVLVAASAAVAASLGCSSGSRKESETATAATAALAEEALSFVEDDYARALAAARERQVPLFIEAWAPW